MLIGCYRLLWVLERSSARAHHVFLLMPVGFCTERMERGCACDDDHCLTSVIVHVQRFKHTLGCIYIFEAVYNACKVRGSDVQYIELSRKLVKAEADRADIKLMSNSPSGSGRNKPAADARVRVSTRRSHERIVARPTLFCCARRPCRSSHNLLGLDTPLSSLSHSLSSDSPSVAAPALDYIPRTFNVPSITHHLSPANYTTWTYPAPE
jgi:hypothetical protein